MMTKKHFQLLADAMVAARPIPDRRDDGTLTPYDELPPIARGQVHQWAVGCKVLADALADQNPRFDKAHFLLACGVTP